MFEVDEQVDAVGDRLVGVAILQIEDDAYTTVRSLVRGVRQPPLIGVGVSPRLGHTTHTTFQLISLFLLV
ncbi:hypothetical protein GCM10027355_16660 [Haloplanus salinarum]